MSYHNLGADLAEQMKTDGADVRVVQQIKGGRTVAAAYYVSQHPDGLGA